MDTIETRPGQPSLRWQQSLASGWAILRQPKTATLLLVVVIVMAVLGGFFPQQTTPETTVEIWTASLPSWLQPWGIPLFWLGFAQIFQSIWFWLPVALLLLSCAVALADYLPFCRRRMVEQPADIGWQHPLAERVEQSIRLPASPDDFLDQLKTQLTRQGFKIDASPDDNERAISAARGRSSWWAVLAVYGGLAGLCLAFIVSYFSLATETITLHPFTPATSRLFNGGFELDSTGTASAEGTITFSPSKADSPQSIPWRLYWPTPFQRTLLIPTAQEPVLTVTAQDDTGQRRKLFPLQTELRPATYLNLPLGSPDEPLFFLIPNTRLLFQITPAAVLADNQLNVQVGFEGTAVPIENRMLTVGEAFTVRGFTVTVALNQQVSLIAWRDWALPLYLVSLIAIVAGVGRLYFRAPWQIWLIPEVKGRGGQLYGVVEKLAFAPGNPAPFLEQLLQAGSSPEANPEVTPD
ncbi:MAG: cytochrome c biogenesis protein ResB [Anaerolineaceae bacterium]|nr:cytochrome c biogenesis protein ResB [Anaerolineaceae bacterium]MCB9102015.1 cytochrome c biogenesis protein ResB [Anaerolineales bacterium]